MSVFFNYSVFFTMYSYAFVWLMIWSNAIPFLFAYYLQIFEVKIMMLRWIKFISVCTKCLDWVLLWHPSKNHIVINKNEMIPIKEHSVTFSQNRSVSLFILSDLQRGAGERTTKFQDPALQKFIARISADNWLYIFPMRFASSRGNAHRAAFA